jgi:hypothetical protein
MRSKDKEYRQCKEQPSYQHENLVRHCDIMPQIYAQITANRLPPHQADPIPRILFGRYARAAEPYARQRL